MTASDPPPAGQSRDPLSTGPTSGTAGAESSGPPQASASDESPRQTDQRQPTERNTGRAIGRTLALVLLIAVTVLLVLFVVFNGQTVDVSLVFVNVDAPLVVALLVAAALGGLLVWLAGLVTRARRRNR